MKYFCLTKLALAFGAVLGFAGVLPGLAAPNQSQTNKVTTIASHPAVNSPSFVNTGVIPKVDEGGLPPVNQHYTPIAVKCSKMSGLSLSGKAKMMLVDKVPGSVVLDDRTVDWQCHYNLIRGCAMLTTKKPILVDALDAKVYLDQGTTAIVHVDDQVIRCVNLTDSHMHSFRLVFGGHYFDIDPGREIVLVKDTHQNPKALAIQEGIGWRDLYQSKVDGKWVFVYRVSAKDTLKTCKIYRQLKESPNALDQELRNDLVKSVAALETMYNKRKGPYHLTPYHYGTGDAPQGETQTASRNSSTAQ
jgi:hypothetical protein